MVLKSPCLPFLRVDPVSAPPRFVELLDDVLTKAHKNRRLLLPNLHNDVESLSVFSDYGGEHRESQYITYSVLVGGWNGLFSFFPEMQTLRGHFGLAEPYKEIAFKSLGYSPLRTALPQILRVADYLVPGLLCTLVVEKSLGTILTQDTTPGRLSVQAILRENGFDVWKAKVSEKALRVAHLAAYLTSLLSRPGHKVFWMTDDDAIAANPEMHQVLATLFHRLLDYYSHGQEFGSVGYTTPFEEAAPPRQDLMDLLALTDLTAGALASWFTDAREGEPDQIRESTNEILLWLCGQGLALKKLTIKIERTDAGGMEAASIRFTRKKEPQELQLIPITF
jgi:hypothetical protein